MDIGIIQQFHEKHIWMPKSPVHDDGIIEISAFTRKYGSQKPKQILVYDLDMKVLDTHQIQVGDCIAFMLKHKVWSQGWSLDIVHAVLHGHDHSIRVDLPLRSSAQETTENIQFSDFTRYLP